MLKHGNDAKLSQHLGPKFRDVAKTVFKTKKIKSMVGPEFSDQMSKLEATLPPLMETLSQLGHDPKWAVFGPKANEITTLRGSVFKVMGAHLPLKDGDVAGARAVADVFKAVVELVQSCSAACSQAIVAAS